MKIQYLFMRVVVQALYILITSNRGFDMARASAVWDNYRNDFLTELAKEEDK